MRVRYGLEGTSELKGCCVALGNFDGVHRGHQKLIRTTVEKARQKGCPSVVITFDPHPALVLNPGEPPGLLTTKEQKIELIAGLGADFLYFLTFDLKLASLTPEAFVHQILWPYFCPSLVTVGFNYTFGRGGRGNPSLLSALGRELGFEVEVIPPVKLGERIVSSTAIREALAQGDVLLAKELLGYWPTLIGRVVSGEGRGRLLGFPTANIAVAPEVMLPAYGVYACRVGLPNGCWREGIVNIGKRPTFGPNLMPTVEVYLLDFSGSLYGEKLKVELRYFLRPEKAFASSDDLVEQIKIDIRRARQVLKSVTTSLKAT
ncbi:MAG: bifunctional riboflavin kinase/FAD synthetase [Thermanaeromonas sp.]|uniref:bifunctional riboflavin kinase/FAD synthetase n=1 Tax=Thermanaeromonas sp. TaxID=2003697 RepID=UPI00243EC079|nr:bifunctional riboflavin kinase/FAD synthetase [Thermanaeromonas sp.]MCG0277266.1 bifunctional riboflavin kinase/FAD synthetase [Thermanaeromonas sp.]